VPSSNYTQVCTNVFVRAYPVCPYTRMEETGQRLATFVDMLGARHRYDPRRLTVM
jgi:hypothetical protein